MGQQEDLAGRGFPGYRCPQCPALPFCLKYLDLHLHSAHGGPQPTGYPPGPPTHLPTWHCCIVCKDDFRTQDILKAHMKEVHSLSDLEINKTLSNFCVESSEPAAKKRKIQPELKTRQLVNLVPTTELKKEVNSILGSMDSFFLASKRSEDLGDKKNKSLSLEEKTEDDMIEKEQEKAEKKVNEEKDEQEDAEEEHDWVEEVESRMMRAGVMFHCSSCSYRSTEEEEVVEHVQSVHLPSFPGYRCPTCTSTLPRLSLLPLHLRQHHAQWVARHPTRFTSIQQDWSLHLARSYATM